MTDFSINPNLANFSTNPMLGNNLVGLTAVQPTYQAALSPTSLYGTGGFGALTDYYSNLGAMANIGYTGDTGLGASMMPAMQMPDLSALYGGYSAPSYDYGSLYGGGAAATPPSAYDYGSLYGGIQPYTPTGYGSDLMSSSFQNPYPNLFSMAQPQQMDLSSYFQTAQNLPRNTAVYDQQPVAPQYQYGSPDTRFNVTQPQPADLSGLGGAYGSWLQSMQAGAMQPGWVGDTTNYPGFDNTINQQAFGPSGFGMGFQPYTPTPSGAPSGGVDWSGMGIDWNQPQIQQPAFNSYGGFGGGLDPFGLGGGTSNAPPYSPFPNQPVTDAARQQGLDYLTQGASPYGIGSYFPTSGFDPNLWGQQSGIQQYTPTPSMADFQSTPNNYNTFQQASFLPPWQASIPSPFNSPAQIDAIKQQAALYGYDPAALTALGQTESGFNPALTTGSYYGVTQMGPDSFSDAGRMFGSPTLGGLTWPQYQGASGADQTNAYGDWLNMYQNPGQGGPNSAAALVTGGIGSLDPAMQFAIMQATQFGPNAGAPGTIQWPQALAAGNMNMPVVPQDAPHAQAESLGAGLSNPQWPTIASMYGAGENIMAGWPQQQLYTNYYGPYGGTSPDTTFNIYGGGGLSNIQSYTGP